MKQFLLLPTLALFLACNSKKKDEPTVTTDTTITTTKPDSIPPVTTGKIDIETFGDIKLGQPVAETIKALGEPSSKTKAVEWGADGLMHEDWEWKSKGLVLGMSSEKGKEATTMTVFSIIATSPCDFKTRAGMGLGSTYAEVQAAYSRDIDPEATDKTQITVGSVYGGIIFSFTNDKASKIFLGAEAE